MFINQIRRRVLLMTDDKKKRLIVAGTVGAVVLACTLILVMVFQICKIVSYNRKTAELDKAIAEYNQMIASGEETLEARKTKAWIVKRAYELGYVFEGDENLK